MLKNEPYFFLAEYFFFFFFSLRILFFHSFYTRSLRINKRTMRVNEEKKI